MSRVKTLAWKVGLPVLAGVCAVIAVFLIITMYQRWGEGPMFLSLFLVKAVVAAVACLHARDLLQQWEREKVAKAKDADPVVSPPGHLP